MILHKCFLLFFFLIITFLCYASIEARPTYVYHNCSTAGKTFSRNSAFQSHQTTRHSSLASTNATVPGGSDTMYGLFMCRGDVSLLVCHQCVLNATKQLPSNCPFSKQGIIWYYECMNISFFSTVDKWPTFDTSNRPNNISDPYQASFLPSFMKETASKAAAAKPASKGKTYAKNQANFKSETVYSLAQCTLDLPLQDCTTCLSGMIRNMPLCREGKIGGGAVNPSCDIRHDLFSFYDSNQPVAPTPAPARTPTPRPQPFFPPTNSSHHPPPPGN